MNVTYNCKFCGNPGSVEIEDNDATMFCIEKWQKMLCCNRCGDYRVNRRRVEDAIKKACMAIVQFRAVLLGEKLFQAEARMRVMVQQLAEQYAKIVCKHYQKMDDFDQSFVDEFMSQPDKWYTILGVFESGIRRARRTT